MIPQGHQVAEAGHEGTDTDVIGVTMLLFLLCVLLAVCFLGVWGLLHFIDPAAKAHTAVKPARPFPVPGLEIAPGRALAKDEAAQEHELNSYGWLSRDRSQAHIPIEKAMAILLERGLPEVGAGQTRAQLLQSRAGNAQQPNPAKAGASPQP